MFPEKEKKYGYEDPIRDQLPIQPMPSDHEIRMRKFEESRKLIEPLQPENFNPYFTHEIKPQEWRAQYQEENSDHNKNKKDDIYDYGLKTKKFKREKVRSKEMPKVHLC